MTAGLTLAPAPAVATVRQGSLSAPAPAATTVQQQGALWQPALLRVVSLILNKKGGIKPDIIVLVLVFLLEIKW